MPELENPRWELFAKLTAMGRSRPEARRGAGYKDSNKKNAASAGAHLAKKAEVAARITELQLIIENDALRSTALNRDQVLRDLDRVYEMGTAATPVTDKDGKPTGEYKTNLSAATRAKELQGKELGMFADRLVLDNLDERLENMSGDELRNFVKASAMEVGLRVIEMSDDEFRTFILRHAPRLGLRVEAIGEDPRGAEASEDRALPSVSEAAGVPPTRRH